MPARAGNLHAVHDSVQLMNLVVLLSGPQASAYVTAGSKRV